mgnify:CR=1 FL=1
MKYVFLGILAFFATLYVIAETTYDEARFALSLLAERGRDTLLVVTDPYHTRRARLIFRRVFAGSGIRVRLRPVPLEQSGSGRYDPDRWWHTPTGLRQTWSEYVKLLLLWLGYHT